LVVALAAICAFVPSFLVLQFFMDLTLAATGTVLLSAAILLLGRWPSRAPVDRPQGT